MPKRAAAIEKEHFKHFITVHIQTAELENADALTKLIGSLLYIAKSEDLSKALGDSKLDVTSTNEIRRVFSIILIDYNNFLEKASEAGLYPDILRSILNTELEILTKVSAAEGVEKYIQSDSRMNRMRALRDERDADGNYMPLEKNSFYFKSDEEVAEAKERVAAALGVRLGF